MERGRLEWESDKMFMDMEMKASVALVADPDADDGSSLNPNILSLLQLMADMMNW